MDFSDEALIQLASASDSESELMDFKREFTPEKKAAFWVEIIKDIVSFANSLGGVLLFGVEDSGRKSSHDCSPLLTFDTADLQNKIESYTGSNIKVAIRGIERGNEVFPAILVWPETTPIVFTKDGTYEDIQNKQKFAFHKGQIYVRHGTKCEPGTRNDIASFIERRVASIREEWLGNIRKVVEAPLGHTVVVSSLTQGGTTGIPLVSARLTNDPSALPVRLSDPKKDWPHRGKDVLNALNKQFPGKNLNSHDLITVRHSHDISELSRPDMMLKSHPTAGPQYANAFLDWIISELRADSEFFEKARMKWRADTYGA
ncbi:MAG: ATP-binding protein [Alphaproteobacteria bacterium]